MSTVWLIRHGESVSNANLPTTHPALSSLTAQGHSEALAVAQAFSQPPDLIVVSSYTRAQETAVPTQQRFPHVPTEIWPVHEFTYLHPSRYDGTTGSDRTPHAHAYWERNDPFEQELGEGESFAALLMRVIAFKDRLCAHPAPFIAVFSHGLFLRAMLWHLLTGNETANEQSMRRYHNFVRGVWMPNASFIEAQFPVNGRIQFSGIRTTT